MQPFNNSQQNYSQLFNTGGDKLTAHTSAGMSTLVEYLAKMNSSGGAGSGTPNLTADQTSAFNAGNGPVNADYAQQLASGQGSLSGANPFYTGNNPYASPANPNPSWSQYSGASDYNAQPPSLHHSSY